MEKDKSALEKARARVREAKGNIGKPLKDATKDVQMGGQASKNALEQYADAKRDLGKIKNKGLTT